MSQKKNKAKARAERAEQILIRERQAHVALVDDLSRKLKETQEKLQETDSKLRECRSALQGEEFLRPWSIIVDGMLRGGVRYHTYAISFQFDPELIVRGMYRAYRPNCLNDVDQYLYEMSRDISYKFQKTVREQMQKDGLLIGAR